MIEMIPNYISKDIKSNAEKNIFSKIANDRSINNLLCFHSLGLSKHSSKRAGEIDFLLLTKDGLFCLEVKGGSVKREQGVWYFIDRFGAATKKRESPFEQASTAMYSLQKNLIEKFGDKIRAYRFGYGVIFPDIRFEEKSPEWNLKIVYDKSYRSKEFSDYFKVLINYWNVKLGGRKQNIQDNGIKEIKNYLRGDFEIIQPLNSKINEQEDNIIKLTEGQYKNLDRMQFNKRVVFQGPAGTGKTLLAFEQLKRKTLQGKKCLFLCFNKLLAKRLEVDALNISTSLKGNVINIHKYFNNVIKDAGLLSQLQYESSQHKDKKYFNDAYSKYFKKALDKLKLCKYDCLIIDEAQDFISDEIYKSLDKILECGLKSGEWYLFLDPHNQGDLFGNYDKEYLINLVNDCGACIFDLDLNCRNTKNIALNTSIISGFRMANTLNDNGPRVVYKWFNNSKEEICLLDDIIKELKENEIDYKSITILHDGMNKNQFLNIMSLNKKYPIKELNVDNINNVSSDNIMVSSIQSYKGLENKVVIVSGMKLEDSRWIDTLNYVGLSRARNMLYILINNKYKKKYEEKIANKYDL